MRGHPGLALALAAANLLAAPQDLPRPDAAPPVPAGITADTFARLSLPHRWLAYQRSLQEHRGKLADWVRFLDARRDFELLEWIAIYGGYRGLFQQGQPGEVLHRHDAPQWMRVALWNLRQRDSHSVEAASGPLAADPARLRGWARKYPAVRRLGAAGLLDKHAAVAPRDPGNQLPPLDPQVVLLPYLDAPRDLATLAPEQTIDPERRYRFQVLQAIQALSVAGRFDEPYHGKLLRLTRHADPLVRRTAMLEFSEFPPARIPFAELFTIADHRELADDDRRAALLTASYAPHPDVYLRLHAVLGDPQHPGFDTVVQRMYALGNGYTTEVLARLPRAGLPPARRQYVERLDLTLRKRPTKAGANPGVLLQRAAWAVFKADPQAAALHTWTASQVRRRLAEPKFEDALRGFVADLESHGVPAALQPWIRAEAQRLLGTR